ncbi:MAG: TerB family tellurite resistance protein [Deltaproteobacteria bacterium]|nr:TerB family tellurite resistance protein [Deltaproteobacteria bacterium]
MERRKELTVNDQELVKSLNHLGIDDANYQLVALLPLVQVGWADGRIQPKERDLILRVAQEGGYLHGDAHRVLNGWLTHPPTSEYQARGRALLLALVHRRDGGLGAGLTVETLDQVLDLCHQVADAAGGIFGVFGRVEPAEREAIAEIAGALSVEPEAVLEELDLDEE